MTFMDRADAGRRLAARLAHLQGEPLVVLGLPRGGVPVAFEVARALGAPLDVIVVRKLGVPFQPELGMGAIGEDGVRVLNREIVAAAGVGEEEIAAVEARERAELDRRVARLRGWARQPLAGRVAVVVDDGIATGSTARAACQVARAQGAARVVLAVPVAPPGWETGIGGEADELISLETPAAFFAIGQFYADFTQTTDEQVIGCLQRAATPAAGAPAAAATRAHASPARADDRPGPAQEIEIAAGGVRLAGRLTIPDKPAGIVVFAHAAATGRHSPRSRYLSVVLHQAGLATLLVDLLSPGEQVAPATVFDVGLLARRLTSITWWLRTHPQASGLPLHYLGTRTAAAAVLYAAAEPDAQVAAVVCRGGRPDLASARLAAVRAPTLLIVAERDQVLARLHRQAQAGLRCENRLAFVPGASDLLEAPGALDAAAGLALDWFTSHRTLAVGPVS